MEIRWRDFPHIYESQQFSRQNLEDIFKVTDVMAQLASKRNLKLLEGYRAILYFYEASTRTLTSFAEAITRLGGVEFHTPDAKIFSSAAKGESLKDTIKVLAGYFPDFIIMRHTKEGAAKEAVKILQKPLIVNPNPPAIISAGDGPGQHPTQSILDLYTIRHFLGKIDGVKVAFVGDLENSRVVRSDCYLLGKFKDVEICFCSPKVVRMKEDIKSYLRRHGVKFWETNQLKKAIKWADFIQDTRVQTERFEKNPEKLQQALIGQSNLVITERRMKQFTKGKFLGHPMPRIFEINQKIDDDSYPENVVFLRQSQFGFFTRMAEVYIIRQNGVVDLKKLKKLAA